MEAVEGCGAISGGIAIIYHSIEDVVKGVKGHFEYGVKVDGMAMESKFGSDVRWSVVACGGISGVPVQPSRKGGRRFPVSLLLLDAVCYDEQLLLRDTHPQRAPCREKDESVLSLYIAIYRPNL